MSDILKEAASLAWGLPLLVSLLFINIILLYHSKFIPLLGVKHALDLVRGKIKHSDGEEDGQITHFQALCNALAATIGLGNISGVAIAIYQGGPGAIFWMWIAAIFGMNTKFFECTLAVMYRGVDFKKEIQGGPMYVIKNGLPKRFHFLGVAFAIFGVIGTLSLFQINQLSHFVETSYEIPKYSTGLFFAVLIAYILFGGLKRITSITSRVVPSMSVLYVLLCLIILVSNFEQIPAIFMNIFTQALTGEAFGGGVIGYGIIHIMKTGVKRAAFSNEAGLGTAPMAHGNAKTSEPVSEGYVAMLGPFIDTIMVCTLTALTILVNYDSTATSLNGINLTTFAFVKSFGESGKHLLGLIILMFSFSTMIGMANYCEKCWNFLLKGKKFLRSRTFIFYYTSTIFIGSIVEMNDVVNLIDLSFALMIIPNMIATLWLAPKVKKRLIEYNRKYSL